jgi:hypothetical protein
MREWNRLNKPGYPLHLKSSDAYGHFVIENGETDKKWSLASVDGSELEVDDFFSISDVGGTSRITVQDGTGDVGIGTFSPVTKLCVAGDITAIGPDWSEGNSAVLYLGAGNYHYIKAKYGTGVQIGTYGAADAITLKETTGNVGIGLTSPEAKLHIEKDTSSITDETDYALKIVDGTNDVGLLVGVDATDHISIIQSFDPATGWATRPLCLMPNGGNVGIGVSNPGSKLEIGLSTENLEIVDAGSAGATEQDWIEVQVGGNTGYIRVYTSK